VRDLQSALLAWARDELRDLPWRRTRDPWSILVAETMLQQTQVSRVAPRWEQFLERWPTAAACAAASRADVVRAWQGLGYNRRAVALHEAARRVVADHDGTVPRERQALLDLPGVGPYTARAVRAFAYELDDGVVDVNAARVLARAVAGRRLTAGEAQALADELVPAGRGWSWNQAVLELGATRCRKRRVACEGCPLAHLCAWRGQGPDPAEGSAGSGRPQPRFEGSDRQGRGRLLDALREGDLPAAAADGVTGWDDRERTRRVLDGLVADGLAARRGGVLTLPG
jgi:A/G-specific adenine glycosylase